MSGNDIAPFAIIDIQLCKEENVVGRSTPAKALKPRRNEPMN